MEYENTPFEPYDHSSPTAPAHNCPNEATLRMARNEIRSLRHKLALLWAYLMSDDAWNDAWAYIQEHSEDATPFDFGIRSIDPLV